MKNKCKVVLLVSFGLLNNICLRTNAQQQTNPVLNIPETPNSPVPLISYPGLQNLSTPGKFNYIKTQVPDRPQTDLSSTNYIRQSTTFYDGLGRVLQRVDKKSQAEGFDIVNHHVYDASGKETIKYLPYASPNSYALYVGKFKPNVSSDLTNFYSPNPGEEPYSKTETDNSPLGLITKNLAPGHSWVGNNRGIEITRTSKTDREYWFNGTTPMQYTTAGIFPKFTIANSSGALPIYQGNFSDGELEITKSTDEDGKITEEVKDKLGRVIMKRSLFQKLGLPNPPVVPQEMFADNYMYTYFVYDDFNRLRVVIPPEACKSTKTNVGGAFNYTWNLNQNQLDGLCFQYFYDQKGRVIEKKLPGKQIEYYVYDKRDRLVMFQDGNMRTNPSGAQWTFTFHDAIGRPIITALCQVGHDRSQMQNLIDDNSIFSAPHWLYYFKNYEIFQVYPSSITSCKILSYNYYDNYTELSNFSYDPNQFNNIVFPNSTVVPSIYSGMAHGLLTGTKKLIIDPDNPTATNYLRTVHYYDAKRMYADLALDNKILKDTFRINLVVAYSHRHFISDWIW